MRLPARISSVTFACRDIGRMAAFYRQFGWPEARSSVPEHIVFQCTNGVVLGLFSARQYESRYGEVGSEFRGFTLAINCENTNAVIRAHEELSEFDDVHELDEQPQQSGWGSGFSFRDPEGNVWDIAWKAGSEFDDRGGFIYP